MKSPLPFALTLLLSLAAAAHAQTNAADWPAGALTLADALNLAEARNGLIAQARRDLEATAGVVLQTRAVVLPRVQATGGFRALEDRRVEEAPGGIAYGQTETWDAGVRLVQSVYEGGRLASAVRSARLQQALALDQFQTVLLDTLTAVRTAYYDTLLAREQIGVQEASVELLERELLDNERRFQAGTVPRFNVLRAEVELANARPRLSRARNAWRIAKTELARLLGFQVANDVVENIPLELAGRLEPDDHEVRLEDALNRALEHRSELAALRKAEQLRGEGVRQARAGHLPSIQGYGGYGGQRATLGDDFTDAVHGWEAGVQATWNLWDGRLTRGRVAEARALQDRAAEELTEFTRQVTVEVRTAYSTFLEAREVLEATRKVIEQAEEALRLARARADAGSGTQLDVLSAQTALTEARTTQNEAAHACLVARARLERAIGLPAPGKETPAGALPRGRD
jgi:outer membrane protein TolC